MPNGWSKQAYIQGFDCETITVKIYKHVWIYGNGWNYLWRCVITLS